MAIANIYVLKFPVEKKTQGLRLHWRGLDDVERMYLVFH